MSKQPSPATAGMKVLAFTNAKGGVGKTTSSANVGMELASRNYRVLLVDLDPQGDLSLSFGVKSQMTNTVGHALLNEAKLKDCIRPATYLNDEDDHVPIPGLSLLPSSVVLGMLEPKISQLKNYETALARKLKEVAVDFDYVVIDCPPALGTLTYLAFCAANAYVIPCAAEQLSFEKISLVKRLADSIAASLNPSLSFVGIVFTRYNDKVKRKLNEAIFMAAQSTHGRDKVLPSIRQDVTLSEAQAYALPAQTYRPNSNGVGDYAKLTTAILKRI